MILKDLFRSKRNVKLLLPIFDNVKRVFKNIKTKIGNKFKKEKTTINIFDVIETNKEKRLINTSDSINTFHKFKEEKTTSNIFDVIETNKEKRLINTSDSINTFHKFKKEKKANTFYLANTFGLINTLNKYEGNITGNVFNLVNIFESIYHEDLGNKPKRINKVLDKNLFCYIQVKTNNNFANKICDWYTLSIT